MKASDMHEKRIVDPKAETIRDLAKKIPYAHRTLRDLAIDYVEKGLWERVWKKQGRQLVYAYRVKKK